MVRIGFAGERLEIFSAPVNPTITSSPRLTSNNTIRVHLPRNQGPIIEVQNHGRIVILARFVRKVRARLVLGGNETKSQGTDVCAVWQFRPFDHLGSGKYRVAGE